MQSLLDTLSARETDLHVRGTDRPRDRLETPLHPQFFEVGRSGRRYTRTDVVHACAHEAAPAPIVARDFAVRSLSETCAMLTYTSSERAPDGSESRATHRASIWVRTDRGWQLFYHQGTPCPDER